jgi:hypothetical protein
MSASALLLLDFSLTSFGSTLHQDKEVVDFYFGFVTGFESLVECLHYFSL